MDLWTIFWIIHYVDSYFVIFLNSWTLPLICYGLRDATFLSLICQVLPNNASLPATPLQHRIERTTRHLILNHLPRNRLSTLLHSFSAFYKSYNTVNLIRAQPQSLCPCRTGRRLDPCKCGTHFGNKAPSEPVQPFPLASQTATPATATAIRATTTTNEHPEPRPSDLRAHDIRGA